LSRAAAQRQAADAGRSPWSGRTLSKEAPADLPGADPRATIARMGSVPEILFVDDNPGDSELIEEAFRQYDVPARFHKVGTGARALDFLHETVRDGAPLPDLVLLDVNLPVMSGHEVLRAIRADPALKDLEVVMISSSERRRDIEASEALEASSYLIKPANWDEYLVLVRAFEQRLKQRDTRREPGPLDPPPPLKGLQPGADEP
jgi:CheY-like chemotaxis protein